MTLGDERMDAVLVSNLTSVPGSGVCNSVIHLDGQARDAMTTTGPKPSQVMRR